MTKSGKTEYRRVTVWLLSAAALTVSCAGPPACAQVAKQILRLNQGGWVTVATFSHDGRLLATGSGERATPGEVRVWDARTGRLLHRLVGRGDEDAIADISFSPDSQTIATATSGNVRLWDSQTGWLRKTLRGELIGSSTTSPHGRLILSSSYMDEAGFWSRAQLWNAGTGRFVRYLAASRGAGNMAFTLDGQQIVGVGDEDKDPNRTSTVRWWNASTGRVVRTVRLRGRVTPELISPHVRLLATAMGDGERPDRIRLWDLRTGRLMQTLSTGGRDVGSLVFTHDGRKVVAGCDQRGPKACIIWWDAATGRPVKRQAMPRSFDGVLAVSPDGRTMATSADQSIYLWRIH